MGTAARFPGDDFTAVRCAAATLPKAFTPGELMDQVAQVLAGA